MKVFCQNCQYSMFSGGGGWSCWYPKNLVIKETPTSRFEAFDRECHEINKNNDCAWFKQQSHFKKWRTLYITVFLLVFFVISILCVVVK